VDQEAFEWDRKLDVLEQSLILGGF
jgi:hypothetical protein